MKCPTCGKSRFTETTVRLAGGIRAQAFKCNACGELILEPKATQKALLLNKLSHGVRVTVGKLGNSLVIRFPAEITELAGLRKGQKLTVTPTQDGKITLSA